VQQDYGLTTHDKQLTLPQYFLSPSQRLHKIARRFRLGMKNVKDIPFINLTMAEGNTFYTKSVTDYTA
jgi:hypothetical protein